MPYISAKRLSDNLLYPPQRPKQLPADNGAAMISNAISAFGGTAQDYEFIELSSQQYAAIMAAQPGRAYLVNDEIVAKTMTLNSNKATITANGTDTATITADTGDANYTGAIRFTLIPPTGDPLVSTVNAVAGVAQEAVTTQQVDEHVIRVESVEFGVKELTIKGV